MKKKNPFKYLEKRFKPRFLEVFYFNRCLNFIAYLVFILVVIILIKAIVFQFIPAQPQQLGMEWMLFEYNGLPFAFWVFLSIGVMFGLCFHGFKLFSINIERGYKK